MSDDFEERAGVLVSPRGVPRLRRADPSRPHTELPGFGRVGYLAVGERELAVFRTPRMSSRPGPKGDALTRVPLTQLVSIALEARLMIAILTLVFDDGAAWELQIARLHRSAAERVVDDLHGREIGVGPAPAEPTA